MTAIRAQINRIGVVLLFIVALTVFTATQAQAIEKRVFEEKPGPIPEFVRTFAAGETITFHTENLSSGVDPVIHFWDLTNNIEVSMDDNGGGGKKALLRARAPHAGDYALIIRQRNFLAEGTLDLYMFGQPWKTNVKVGGRFVVMLSLQPKEQVIALSPPRGPSSHFLYVISDDGLHIESRLRGAPRSRWEAPASTFGARTFLLGVREADAGKPIRVYRNDAKLPNYDLDGDGLGLLLEQQLKTCSSKTDVFDAFTCDRVADVRDTDGDGISDGWEVLGRDYGSGSSYVYVALPTWGANPRHKDMFIEADYRRLTLEENNAQVPEHMPPSVAIQFANTYGDMNTTDPLIRLYHAQVVGNPDGQPGISVHIDTGLPPQSPQDVGIYGNWGGYNAIDAIPNSEGNYGGQEPGKLWMTQMHPARRGIFFYGPGHKGGGGQCIVGAISCGYNFMSAANAIHEMMHALGLNHSGPSLAEKLGANCKPNYPSAVNYVYQNKMLLSDGRDRAALNNTALTEWQAVSPSNKTYLNDLQETFKFIVDPVNGHVDWNRDGVFAPAGQTVRGYANYAPDKNCEFTRTNEVQFSGKALSVAIAHIGKQTLYFYVTEAGKVRFRRSTSSWNCPAAEKNCAGSSFGPPTDLTFPKPIQSLDAEPVNVNGEEQLSVIAIDQDGVLRERRMRLQSNGSMAWYSDMIVLPSAVEAAGEPSLAETRDGTGIYLSYKGTDNVLRWRYRNNTEWEDERIAQDLQDSNLTVAPDASPGIASAYLSGTSDNAAALYLAYADAQSILRIMTLNAQGLWENTNLQAANTQNIIGRPAMAWVPNTMGFDSPGQFYLVVRDQNNVYKMLRTYFDKDSNKILIGLNSFFDNVWLSGNTIDLTASSSSGHPQLWAALTFPKESGPLLLFRPRADGISDVKQSNFDDWLAVSSGLCNVVASSDSAASSPLRCQKWPWP